MVTFFDQGSQLFRQLSKSVGTLTANGNPDTTPRLFASEYMPMHGTDSVAKSLSRNDIAYNMYSGSLYSMSDARALHQHQKGMLHGNGISSTQRVNSEVLLIALC